MAEMQGEPGGQPVAPDHATADDGAAYDVPAGDVAADDMIAEQAAELATEVSEAPGAVWGQAPAGWRPRSR